MLVGSRELNIASLYLLTNLLFVRLSERDRVGGALCPEPQQVKKDPIFASRVSRNQDIFPEFSRIHEDLRLPERLVPPRIIVQRLSYGSSSLQGRLSESNRGAI